MDWGSVKCTNPVRVHGTDVWKLAAYFGLYIYVKSLKTVPSVTIDHLQQSRADKFSTLLKSEAFTFSSASLIELIQLWSEMLQYVERFSLPCCLLHLIEIWFFSFGFLKAAFLSFIFFFRFSMCRKVFNKTIILLGLARYEMIITTTQRFVPRWLCIISYPAHPRGIIVEYIYSFQCLISPAFSHLRLKNYCWSYPSPGYASPLLLRLVHAYIPYLLE